MTLSRCRNFNAIVSRFYEQVRKTRSCASCILRRPTGAEQRLRMFLEQYWGGREPTPTNAGTRGCGCGTRHSVSLKSSGMLAALHAHRCRVHRCAHPRRRSPSELLDYLEMAAQSLVNTHFDT